MRIGLGEVEIAKSIGIGAAPSGYRSGRIDHSLRFRFFAIRR
jgi:hypothetical protein